MVTHLVALAGVAVLLACGAGVRGGGPAPCALRVAEGAGGVVLTAEARAGADWTLRAAARDGSVDMVQSGTAGPEGAAAVARLPGRAAAYDLTLTVGGGSVCPVVVE